jgi:hypothetical protein
MIKKNPAQKLFEGQPLLICLLSVFFTIVFLLQFDREMALPRIRNQQITHFSSGDKIFHIPAKYFGKTKTGEPLIKDLYGSILLIDEAPYYLENTYIIVSGKIGKNREIIVDEMRVFPDIFWKFFVSFLAVLLLAIKLVKNVRFTSRGLELKVKSKP